MSESTNTTSGMYLNGVGLHPDILEVMEEAKKSGVFQKLRLEHFESMNRGYSQIEDAKRREQLKSQALLLASGAMPQMLPNLISALDEEVKVYSSQNPEYASVVAARKAEAGILSAGGSPTPTAPVSATPVAVPLTPVAAIAPAAVIVDIPETHRRSESWVPLRPAMYMLTTDAILATAAEVIINGKKEIRYRPIQGALINRKPGADGVPPIYVLRLMKAAVVQNVDGMIGEVEHGDVQVPGVFGLHHLGNAYKMIEMAGGNKYPVVEIWPLRKATSLSFGEEWMFWVVVMPDTDGKNPKMVTLSAIDGSK